MTITHGCRRYALWIAFVCFGIAGCSSTEKSDAAPTKLATPSSGTHSAADATKTGSVRATKATAEPGRTSAPSVPKGTIIYQDRSPGRGNYNPKRHRFSGITLIITTAPEELATSGPQVTVVRSRRQLSKRDLAQMLQGSRAAPKTELMNPREFGELAERLEATGLFDLPAFSGKKLPEDATLISLEWNGKKRVVLKPTVDRVHPDSEGIKSLAVWRAAVNQLVAATTIGGGP